MFSARATICCLVISLYIVVSKCNAQGYPAAPICARVECPTYTVVHSQAEFEIRSYNKSRWVASPGIRNPHSYNLAARIGSKILGAYFNGENFNNIKVKATAPVVVAFDDVGGYRVLFLMPAVFNVYPPIPYTDDVNFTQFPQEGIDKPKNYAAVRRFDGVITDDAVAKQIDALQKSLKSTPYQRAAATHYFAIADYSSPDQTSHLNEAFLWFD